MINNVKAVAKDLAPMECQIIRILSGSCWTDHFLLSISNTAITLIYFLSIQTMLTWRSDFGRRLGI